MPFAREAGVASEDRQGNHLAGAKRRLGAGRWPLCGYTRLAKVVNDDVECGEEGVHVEHEESAPFPSGIGISRPTVQAVGTFRSKFAQIIHTKRLRDAIHTF